MIYQKDNGNGETLYQNYPKDPTLIATYKHQVGYNKGYYTYIGQPYNQDYRPLGMRFFKYDGELYNRGLLRIDFGGFFIKEYDQRSDRLVYAYQDTKRPGKCYGFYWEYLHSKHTFKLYDVDENGKFTVLFDVKNSLALEIMEEVYSKTLTHANQDNVNPDFNDIFYQSGAHYSGQTVNISGLTPDLFGLIFWENQDYYVGEWIKGIRTGYGFYSWKNAPTLESYQGDFIDNKITGLGCYNYKNRDFYQGTLKNGEFQGLGRFVWHDAQGKPTVSYLGEWKDGKRNGYGRVVFKDGSKQVGRFENDRFIG